MRLNPAFQTFALIAALVGSLVFGVTKCSQANKLERRNTELEAENTSMKSQRAEAYAYADSITKANAARNKEIKAVLRSLPGTVVYRYSKSLLAELDSIDQAAQRR